MKWFLIFALAFAVGNCGVTKRDDGDSAEKEDVFECHGRGETEISLEQVCDGTEDCKRGEDESVWACAEKNDEFICWNPDGDPFAIPNSKTCDEKADCPIHPWSHSNVSADESKYECHDPETEFVCNEEMTIPLSKKCDGNNDCPESRWGMFGDKTRDEDLWECKPEGTFLCWEDEKYIDENKLCDGIADCSPSGWSNTSADEILYNCPEEMLEGKFMCWGGIDMIDEDLVCDGNNDCPIDDLMGIAADEAAYECATEDEFVCDAKTKIKNAKKCDGENDCPGEDERSFFCDIFKRWNETEFHCHRANITITADQMCDGTNDCPGADEDEYNCPEETEDKDNNINEITRRKIMKERELNEYLEKKGIHRRSVSRI